jgi:hypothetical protein
MNIEFTQDDFKKLDNLIGNIPFFNAYPLFHFFQGKVIEAQKAQQPQVKTEEDGNQTNG